MQILVIGGSGFVGRNIVEYFSGKDAFVVDAPSHAALDALDEDALRRWLDGRQYDAVFNCVDLPSLDGRYLEDRLRMFSNLANASGFYGKMIYFGTGAEYGRHIPLDCVREEEIGRCVPRDTYGLCMYEENELARASDNIYNLRLFGIFGQGEHWESRFISNAICKALCGYPITVRQNRIMDFLYIDDLCRIAEWAVASDTLHHDYNAVSGVPHSLIGLAEEVRQVTNADVPILVANEGDGLVYTADNQRLLLEMPEFAPEPIGRSIEKLADYYRRNLSTISREALLYP